MSTSSRFAVAVHILTLMAWSDEEPLKSEQVAESVNTNPVVIRRLLCELSEAKLVVSQTGSLGGSRLGRKPGEITLLDVYRAVECPGVFSLHRQPPSRNCPVGVNIETVLGSVFSEADTAVERVLAGINIRDLVTRLKPTGVASRKHARAEKFLRDVIPEQAQGINKRGRSGIAKEQ
jgi:Rrf2 family protein